MNKQQLLLGAAGILLICLIYFGAKTVSDKPKMAKNDGKTEQNDDHEHNSEAIANIDFEDLKKEAYAAINNTQKQSIQALEGKTDLKSLLALSNLWGEAKQANMAAKYNGEAAKLEKSEKKLTFASRYFIDLLNIETNPAIKKWQAGEAIGLLELVLKQNPKNTDATIALATCYTEGVGETMKGVQLLLGVARENPKNVTAAIILGKMAVQSAQFDKAITRLEGVLAIEPKNTEAMYHLAEAYKGKGNVSKAKELLNKCKNLVNKPEFGKEIDTYINTF